MGQAGAGGPPLVDGRVDVGEPLAAGLLDASVPRLRDRLELRRVQLAEGANVLWTVHDNLLPLERGVEVGDDPHLPSGRVRSATLGGKGEHLRRRSVLSPLAEG